MRNNRTRVLALFLGASLSIGSVVLAKPVAAQAVCPKGYMCGYDGYNYSGIMFKFADNNPDWRLYGKSDMMSSIYNNGNTHHVRYYDNINYRGEYDCALKDQQNPNVGRMDNRASSNVWFPHPQPCHI